MNVSSVPTLSVRASVSCHPPKDLLVLVNLSEAKDLLSPRAENLWSAGQGAGSLAAWPSQSTFTYVSQACCPSSRLVQSWNWFQNPSCSTECPSSFPRVQFQMKRVRRLQDANDGTN